MLRYDKAAVRKFRIASGLDTDTLGRKARMTGRGVRMLEQGTVPRADTLGRIAAALGVPVEAFYVRTPRKATVAVEAKESAA